MNNNFETEWGSFTLNRNDGETNLSLQAWSSADLYILERLRTCKPAEKSSILLFNDSFGALTIALAPFYTVYNLNDSFCSRKEILRNLSLNNLDTSDVHFLKPGDKLPGEVSFVLLRNPKSLNFLEYQLQLISSELGKGVPVIGSDMSKNIHSSTVTLFEHYLSDVSTSLAWRKSRLIEGCTGGPVNFLNHYPRRYTPLEETFEMINYPNLFAFGRLDPGTAFLLANFPFAARTDKVVDLACGDGILALKAASQWPEAELLCVDESYLAIQSTRESCRLSGFPNHFEFRVTDVLEGVEDGSADLVLCNPPFHDNHSLSTATALKMFRESLRVLKEKGELFIVANRHLAYEKQLSKIFSKAQVLKSSKKFSIIRAVK
jgi:16S rRNA G1207 methylase RsmC